MNENNNTTVQLYLDLLKSCLLNLIYEDPPIPHLFQGSFSEEEKSDGFHRQKRLEGRDWPSQAHTMIGLRRLDNTQMLTEKILQAQVPGDLIETGVWRGGSTIFMRGILKAYGITDRTVWVADSFQGAPPLGDAPRSYTSPETTAAMSLTAEHPEIVQSIVARLFEGTSYEEVQAHFASYGLLDDQVRFLRGWFRDTLPNAPITRLALMRLDGDLYDSTYDSLEHLYPKLSAGGYVIVDDYGSFTECRQAVHDYLNATHTEVKIQQIDQEAVFWRKQD